MKKAWKWIVGIVIGLVVLALVVGGVYLVATRLPMHAVAVRTTNPGTQTPNTGRMPFFGNGNGQRGFNGRFPGMMPYSGRGEYFGPMGHMGMMGRGFIPFGGLIGGFFFLVFVALIVLGIVWLVKSLSGKTEAVAAAPVVASHPCKKCGEPVQDGWTYCPHCGKKA
ncbi:MAG TPA: zinc ribbon domain-containing protein [Anaerolineales bacterium]|nr:zinc ribbon domain-containing protein [Anaerolineales bacterium]